MKYKFTYSLLCLVIGATACKTRAPKQKEIVKNVVELGTAVPANIQERLSYLADNNGKMEDSLTAFRLSAIQEFYQQHANAPQWSAKGIALPMFDTMYNRIVNADEVGLLPDRFHYKILRQAVDQLRRNADSAKMDAALWGRVDVMLTDAFMKMVSGLHFGVTPRDSITLRRDSLYTDTALVQMLSQALETHRIGIVLDQVQPGHEAYLQLKDALKNFKEKYKTLSWDTLPLTITDTLAFRSQLRQRLIQTGHMDTLSRDQDTVQLQAGIKAFQEEFNMYADGKAGKKTLQALNRPYSDWMEQAAVNLDRWRKLPDSLPHRYIFVNLPGFWMHVVEDGEVALASRIIVGAPKTRSPLLTSTLTNFQLYPYWRVPFSITVKEMIPAIKRNINYLAKKNLQVIGKDGQEVDPSKIDWSRMGQHYFPYTLRQMDGEDNSLGVMKFNFFNKYSVYLHDTNNRGLFKNAFRALSHGCVRVQQWDSLANYLVSSDSTHPFLRDSIKVWLARGERKQVDLRNRIPVYFRYFTAEAGENGKLRFNEDIYGEDKIARRWLETE
ncbi:Murein L,D-transpeptidase YcbB/YkuD [Chitinophaga costaii]|uniref:Murein L,D-transpeptidase YcbB/YkuD n=1 Tax=Chitinophaga costaii TaxID=1335309 RepID=A0A1C4DBG9_9BACT|nr:L,D-transpeptidase family protein [Chitinophaga costaii]PUZ24544.1 hypothetical protein DCM91_11655 [Chitinophaga costaii]SCC28588.1 Murein L,D-transpeptidase YcbB/YkuD [Chitinophaga costaii]